MVRPANPELRNEILKAAAFIVEDCGPDCVTMRQVADKIGYSPTTIYLYFKDKSAVLRATVAVAFADLAESCSAASVGPRALDRLRQRSRAYVVWGVMNPGHYRLMFEFSEELQFAEEDFARMHETLSWIGEILRQAVAEGELSADADMAAVTQAVWAGLHGAASLAITRRLAPSLNAAPAPHVVAAATAAADLLLNGLLEAARP